MNAPSPNLYTNLDAVDASTPLRASHGAAEERRHRGEVSPLPPCTPFPPCDAVKAAGAINGTYGIGMTNRKARREASPPGLRVDFDCGSAGSHAVTLAALPEDLAAHAQLARRVVDAAAH